MVWSDAQNLVGVFVLVLMVVGFVWYRLRQPPLVRLLSGFTPTSLRLACDGDLVKVVGTIRSEDLIRYSPVTGKSSVWSITGVYKLRGVWASNPFPWWENLAREVQSYDFLLDEGGGLARVHGSNLRVVSNPDLDRNLGDRRDGLDDRAARFLDRYSVPITGWMGWVRRDLRMLETVLEPGDHVAVLGRLRVLSPLPADGIAHEITPLPEGYVVVSDWPETFH